MKYSNLTYCLRKVELKLRNDIKLRVEREKNAHGEDGILEAAVKLKDRFSHIMEGPSMQRCDIQENLFFDDVKNKSVLDIGCGFGEKSFMLASRGANVLGVDISDNYIEFCSSVQGQMTAGNLCKFKVMDVHYLDLPDNHFDYVFGRGIIHHLDLQRSMVEIRRVLKPGGRAIFLEPLAANPLLRLFRLLTPYARTVDEQPLTSKDLLWIEKNWSVDSSYYGLITAPLAMLTSLLIKRYPLNPLLLIADKLEILLNKISFLQKYN